MEMAVKLRAWATVWATTTPQCTLGTREDKQRFNFVYVDQRNEQRIPLLVENHIDKNLYQLNFDR